jgi:hypothetical protein
LMKNWYDWTSGSENSEEPDKNNTKNNDGIGAASENSAPAPIDAAASLSACPLKVNFGIGCEITVVLAHNYGRTNPYCPLFPIYGRSSHLRYNPRGLTHGVPRLAKPDRSTRR